MASPFSQAFDEKAQQTMKKYHVPGLALSVVHGSETFFTSYGNSQLDPPIKTESSHLFFVCSTTKAILSTAWAIYIDSEENKAKPSHQQIKWSTPLTDIIPDDFVLSDSRTTEVTIEDCLAHRTGMSRHETSYGLDGPHDVKSLVRNLRHLPLHTPLRSTMEYCNLMYVAATHALETATGKPLSKILHETLWTPLSMNHTYAGYDEARTAESSKQEQVATGYSWSKLPGAKDEDSGRLCSEPMKTMPEVSGAGFVLSSVEDYAKWMKALLYPSKDGPVTPEIVKELWTPRSIVPKSEFAGIPFDGIINYGLGWFMAVYHGHSVYWHPGGVNGAGSCIMFVPDLKWGATFFANGANVSLNLMGLMAELLDIVLEIPEEQRVSRKKCDDYAMKVYQDLLEKAETARKDLYPDASSKIKIASALPVKEYAGVYSHPGYGRVEFKASKTSEGEDCLVATPNRTFSSLLELQHVNAEHWILNRRDLNVEFTKVQKAQSEIGVDGKVKRLGLTMEPNMPDTLMWFDRES